MPILNLNNVNKLVAVTILFLCATVVSAQKVQVGQDRTVNLASYKTYTMDKGAALGNPIVHRMILELVDQALAAKGMSKVEADADLTVVVFAATDTDLQISNPSWAPGLNSINTGVVVGAQTFPVTKGTLVVDLQDAKTNNSVWRGTATDTLKHPPTGDAAKDAKNVEKQVRKAVNKLFKKFPSHSGT